MSVRFQFAGDKDISVGRAGGASVFSLPGPISFPPAGTILNVYGGVEYPLANGGASVEANGNYYPSQYCDVYLKADGVGGSYYDWANAFNVTYKPYGTSITSISGTSYVTINGTQYPNGSYYSDYFHDGSGGSYSSGSSSYSSYGTFITSDSNSGSNSISTPVGSFAYESWTGNDYYHDGMGGYYSNVVGYSQASDGTFIGSDTNGGSLTTEVPSGSGNYFAYHSWSSIDYYFQLSGYTYYGIQQGTSTASYGQFITYDGSYNYYWDGSGGYYY